MSALLIFLGAWGGGPASAAAAAPDEDESRAFLEAWVFGGDREAAIDRLVPGTERYFLFRCLLHQSERRLDLADAVLEEAAAARVSSPRLEQMRNRQAVLRGGADPKRMIERLKRKLGLRLDHRRPNAASDASLPTSLPSETLDRNRLFREALRRDPARIVEFSDAALPSLAVRDDLSDAQVRSLLERLDHPAVPGLAELVIRDLRRRSTSDFGSIGIHRRLLRSQLLRCLDARPDLQDDPEFVATYLARLAPRPNEDPELDPTDREACLARLESFVYRLSPVFLPLRAHVLYHRLRHERSQGRFDRERFLEYVRLPRVVSYGNPEGLRGKRAFRLGTVTDTGFAPVKDDEALVHELFLELFRDEESYEPYQRHVREEVLRKWFVESKLLYGKGDVSRYASILDDPAEFAAIRDRVEIRFAETMPPVFRANDPVVLDVDVKNVRDLVVDVYEIDTFHYYRSEGEEVDPALELEGLAPTFSRRMAFDSPPEKRVRRRVELDGLDRPGVWVVDLFGNGLQSRAVVRKGALRHVETSGPRGHVFRIFDEGGSSVDDASIWIEGREFEPLDDGTIRVPFSTDPGEKKILIRRGDLASLASFDHAGEAYELEARAFVPRECLVAGAEAPLLVRPVLRCNGQPVPIAALEKAVLVLESEDLDGIEIRTEIRDPELAYDREWVHVLAVPDRLRKLRVHLEGEVARSSNPEPLRLSSKPVEFEVNRVDTTSNTRVAVLGRDSKGLRIELRGKNGEVHAGVPVSFDLRHRDFRGPIRAVVATDGDGNVGLGSLPGVTDFDVILPEGRTRFVVPSDRATRPAVVHARAGESVRIEAGDVAPGVPGVALLERGAQSWIEDRSTAVRRDGEAFVVTAPGPGLYDLRFPDGETVELRVAPRDAKRGGGWIRSGDRAVRDTRRESPRIGAVDHDGERLRVEVAGAGSDARVHVFSSRYGATQEPLDRLDVAAVTPDVHAFATPRTDYREERRIGDELRYVLDRRSARKFPGNPLARPRLLLQPFVVETADRTRPVSGATPGAFRQGMGGGSGGGFRGRSGSRGPGPGSSEIANLDFLPGAARWWANLEPVDGVVEIETGDLGASNRLHVLLLDGEGAAVAHRVVSDARYEPRDLRLARSLDPEAHLLFRDRSDVVAAGASVRVPRSTGSAAESIASLDEAFDLLRVWMDDPDFRDFRFLGSWGGFDEERKLELYDRFACHELHVFLARRDPEFFERIVRPHLENKLEKTFVDHWCLGDDLTPYLRPYAYERLNLVERILLAGRLPEHRAAIVRRVEDAFDRTSDDTEAFHRRFETALRSYGLDGGRESAFGQAGRPVAGVELEAAPSERAEWSLGDADGVADDAPAAASRRARAGKKAVREEARESNELIGLGGGADFEILYRDPDETKETAETQYWETSTSVVDSIEVPMRRYWRDLARTAGSRPFVSARFLECTASIHEALLALAFLDLPFGSVEPEIRRDEDGATIAAGANPLVVFRRAIEPAEPNEGAGGSEILVRQSLFDPENRFEVVEGRRVERFVSGDLRVGKVYGCQVVVTNPGSVERSAELLLQIPQGALPVASSARTDGDVVRLSPFSAARVEYAFYFPAPGTFDHYPVHVGIDGRLAGHDEPRVLRVVDEPVEIDIDSWSWIATEGSIDRVLRFLREENLVGVDLSRIAWRMRDEPAYRSVVDTLRERLAWHPELWGYGFLHRDERAMRQWLESLPSAIGAFGPTFESALLEIDPVERGLLEQLEYRPLINARAHRFGDGPRIANERVRAAWLHLLGTLAYRSKLTDEDRMRLAYGLLSQDRVGEAIDVFAAVERERVDAALQYDAMAAYLDFYSEDPAAARVVAERHRDHPVAKWRATFRDMLRELDAIEGVTTSVAAEGPEAFDPARLSEVEPTLEMSIAGDTVRLAGRGVAAAELRFYPMEVELLFSSSPFVRQDRGAFSFVRPARTVAVELATEGGSAMRVREIAIPPDLAARDILVEVRSGGISRRQVHHANDLDVRWIENFGHVEVRHRDTGRPLSRVYVKVFARGEGGEARFHKDGYTDHRGRFDYLSVTGSDRKPVDELAVLVLSEEAGATVREVRAPAR